MNIKINLPCIYLVDINIQLGQDDGRLSHISKWLVEHSSIFRAKMILDVGSHTGQFPILYSINGAKKVTAIEPREVYTKHFHALMNFLDTYQDVNRYIDVIQKDCRDVNYKAIGKVDVLSTIGIIYHLDNVWEWAKNVLLETNPDVWIIESQLYDVTHNVVEGGENCADPTQSWKTEFVLKPTKETVEEEVTKLGYKPQWIDFGSNTLYAPASRGFWYCEKI